MSRDNTSIFDIILKVHSVMSIHKKNVNHKKKKLLI